MTSFHNQKFSQPVAGIILLLWIWAASATGSEGVKENNILLNDFHTEIHSSGYALSENEIKEFISEPHISSLQNAMLLIILLVFISTSVYIYRRQINNLVKLQKQKSKFALPHKSNGSTTKDKGYKPGEHERQLASLIGNLPGFVYRCKNDQHWTMLYISEGCKNITGYEPEDFLHNNKISFSSIIKPEFRLLVEEEWKNTLEKKSFFTEEYEIITADNQTKWLLERGVGIHDHAGKLLFLEGYIEDISERKRVQLNLVESEEKFRSLFHDHAAIKLIINPENGNIVDANQAAALFYGWSIKELTRMRISQINVLPADEIKREMTAAKNKTNTYFEFRHRKANGEIADVEVFSSRVNIGNRIFLHSIIHDITEKKKAEDSLKESEERNRLIMDNSMDAIVLTKPDGSILSANKAACDIFQMTEEELYKVGRKGVADPEDPRLPILLKQREETGMVKGEVRFIRKDGTKFPADISSVLFRNSKGELFSSMIFRDITQRKKAENELKNSNEFNKTLLQTIPFGMDIVDEQGVILFQNQQLRQILGQKATMHRCYESYRDDNTRCENCPLETGLEIGKTKTIESDGILGGRTFLITHTGMMFNGKKTMLEIFQDITERKNWENQLLEAKEKAEVNDRLKSAFLSNMSHEIRTPMNGILGFISLLSKPDLTETTRQDYLNMINHSGQRLLDTINDIIEISRIEAGEQELIMSQMNLKDSMLSLMDSFMPQAVSKGIELEITGQLTGQEADITTDKAKITSILTIILKNALKFTSKGKISLGNYLENGMVVFFIKDTGRGIPANKLKAVFERFVQADHRLTRAHEGSGLGLTIAKSYTEILGGEIWVESEVGRGSTFFFSIPYNPVEKKDKTHSSTIRISEDSSPEKTILIAEDDEISYLYLEFILEQEKIPIIRTANGIDTVNALKANPAIALILMDIKMPGMDGLEATREIRKFNQSVPIVAQTAYSLSGDKEKALNAGCNDYITKPVEQSKLHAILKKYYSNNAKV